MRNRSSETEGPAQAPPVIPDYEMLRRIGRGSYGDVWLARGVTGVYRAVKVVWREYFEREKSFEREFEGIRKFEPVSRRSQGLVDLLHVGRNEQQGFYYYVMELADDAEGASAAAIQPAEYTPRTLTSELERDNATVLSEFLRHGRMLCDALQFLHDKGLTHRDIKPSNIIFVEGLPRLADIGLVAPAGRGTYVGTEGYIPPEGPGASSADIYSLGMVLYEVMTGRDRLDFPELPPEKNPAVTAATWRQLNEIVCRACAPTPGKRFPSAAALGRAIEALASPDTAARGGKAVFGVAAVVLLSAIGFIAWNQQAPTPGPAPTPTPSPTPSPVPDPGGGNGTSNGTPGVVVTPVNTNNVTPGDVPEPGDPSIGPQPAPGDPRDPDPPDPGPGPEPPLPKPRLPERGKPWTNSIGMEFRPEGKFHRAKHPVETPLFNRFIDETSRTFEGEVIPIQDDGTKYRHIIAVPESDAHAFCEWMRKNDLKHHAISEDHYYIAEPFDNYASRNENGELVQLAFFCMLVQQEYGALEITSHPAGATVYRGDEVVGTTPFLEPRIQAGPVHYRLHLQGFKQVEINEIVPPDETLSLPYALEETGAVVMGKPWRNSLGMEFVPLGGILFSIWETRKIDFDAFVRETAREPHHIADFDQADTDPVVWVNRQDAIDFCQWLTSREREAGLLEPDQEYRLPTDQEWSQAVGLPRERGEDPASRSERIKGIYPWGYAWPPESGAASLGDGSARDNLGRTLPGYEDGFPFTAPAGSFPSNELGIFDLSGNAWEWVSDPFGGFVERFRGHGVVRGGSWSSYEPDQLLSSFRNAIPADLRDPIYGFRCVIARVNGNE